MFDLYINISVVNLTILLELPPCGQVQVIKLRCVYVRNPLCVVSLGALIRNRMGTFVACFSIPYVLFMNLQD